MGVDSHCHAQLPEKVKVSTPTNCGTAETIAPASSAGVERVFSAAGKMHGDLRINGKADTLEHAIIAVHNIN